MTENPRIRFIVVLVLAMLMLLLWGTAAAQTKVSIRDIAENEVVKNFSILVIWS